MRFVYPAVFKKTEQGTFRGMYPDFGNFGIEDPTFENTIREMTELLRGWITEDIQQGEKLPPVSDIADVRRKYPEDDVRNIAVIVRVQDGWDE